MFLRKKIQVLYMIRNPQKKTFDMWLIYFKFFMHKMYIKIISLTTSTTYYNIIKNNFKKYIKC